MPPPAGSHARATSAAPYTCGMEITREELRGNCPPGWLLTIDLIWDVLEQWRPVAEITGEPRPIITRWTRGEKDQAVITTFPWLEFEGFGSCGDYEMDKLEKLGGLLNRLAQTCEVCGGRSARKHKDPRAGGGALFLCYVCLPTYADNPEEPLRNDIGAPFEEIVASDQLRLGFDDRPWSPGKDREDDARDGLLDPGDDIPF